MNGTIQLDIFPSLSRTQESLQYCLPKSLDMVCVAPLLSKQLVVNWTTVIMGLESLKGILDLRDWTREPT